MQSDNASIFLFAMYCVYLASKISCCYKILIASQNDAFQRVRIVVIQDDASILVNLPAWIVHVSTSALGPHITVWYGRHSSCCKSFFKSHSL